MKKKIFNITIYVVYLSGIPFAYIAGRDREIQRKHEFHTWDNGDRISCMFWSTLSWGGYAAVRIDESEWLYKPSKW